MSRPDKLPFYDRPLPLETGQVRLREAEFELRYALDYLRTSPLKVSGLPYELGGEIHINPVSGGSVVLPCLLQSWELKQQ